MTPSRSRTSSRFLRINDDVVDHQLVAASRDISRLQERLTELRRQIAATARASDGAQADPVQMEAMRLRHLIASRRAHLLSLERMRGRSGSR